MDHQTVEELVSNDKDDMILERFSLEGGFLVIGPLNTVLNKLEGSIFFGFMADFEVHRLVAILEFLSRIYPFDQNIFVQNVGGWFGHTPLNKFISFLVCFIIFFFLKLEDEFSFWRGRMI